MWHPWIDWWQLKSFACNSFHLWNGVKVPCPYNNNLPGNHCGNMMKYATYAWSCSEISQSFSFKICSLFVHHNEWNAAVGIWKLTPPRWFWEKPIPHPKCQFTATSKMVSFFCKLGSYSTTMIVILVQFSLTKFLAIPRCWYSLGWTTRPVENLGRACGGSHRHLAAM